MKSTLTGRCGSCGEHHNQGPGAIGCPPYEVRTTGVEWFKVYIEELEAEVERLQAALVPFTRRTAGERPGDTLLRVVDDVSVRNKEQGVEDEDWREQLRDFGRLMNEAAKAAEAAGGE